MLAVTAISMIASIALEHHGVPLERAAQMSLARFSNTGPEAFLTLILARNSIGISLRLLTAFLIITSLVSQFTSTLLLSDMAVGQIISFASNETVRYARSRSQSYSDVKEIGTRRPWQNNPSQFEVFAEYSEDGTRTEGVDDTGPILRAFLPIAQQQTRESLHRFQGLSYVYDARVVCVRPQIEKMWFCPDNTTSTQRVCGSIKPEQGLLDNLNLIYVNGSRSMTFSCTMTQGYAYPWQLCNLGSYGMLPINNEFYYRSAEELSNSTVVPMMSGGAFLLWNINNNNPNDWFIEESSLSPKPEGHFLNETIDILLSNKSGPWIQVSGTANNENHRKVMAIKASICFDSG
jgi:hypothetical protein